MSRKLVRLVANAKKFTIREVYDEIVDDETVIMRDSSGNLVSGVLPHRRVIEESNGYPNEKTYRFHLNRLINLLEVQEPRESAAG